MRSRVRCVASAESRGTYVVTEKAERFTAFGTECQMVDGWCRTSWKTLDKVMHGQMISLWSILISVEVRRIPIIETIVRFQNALTFSKNIAIESILVDIGRLRPT